MEKSGKTGGGMPFTRVNGVPVVGSTRNRAGCRSAVGRRQVFRERIAQEAQAVRIRGNSGSGTNHPAVVQTISDAETRKDRAPAHVVTGVLRQAAHAAHDHVGCLRQGRIQAIDTRMIAIRRRIELVAESVGDGQLGSRLPLILRVDGNTPSSAENWD